MKTAIIKYMYVVCISEDTHSISKIFIFAIRVWFWVTPPPKFGKRPYFYIFFGTLPLGAIYKLHNRDKGVSQNIILDYGGGKG